MCRKPYGGASSSFLASFRPFHTLFIGSSMPITEKNDKKNRNKVELWLDFISALSRLYLGCKGGKPY